MLPDGVSGTLSRETNVFSSFLVVVCDVGAIVSIGQGYVDIENRE
jgi:hypothetical protein